METNDTINEGDGKPHYENTEEKVAERKIAVDRLSEGSS